MHNKKEREEIELQQLHEACEDCKKECEVKCGEYQEKWQRALADLENQRKRHEADKPLWNRMATASLIEELLPVVDNFYRALEHIPEDQKADPWVSGIMYIQKNLLDVFEQRGLKEMEVKAGDQFDPSKHEAIGTAWDENFAEDMIIEVSQRGYLLGEVVLRPARVIVCKTTEHQN